MINFVTTAAKEQNAPQKKDS